MTSQHEFGQTMLPTDPMRPNTPIKKNHSRNPYVGNHQSLHPPRFLAHTRSPVSVHGASNVDVGIPLRALSTSPNCSLLIMSRNVKPGDVRACAVRPSIRVGLDGHRADVL